MTTDITSWDGLGGWKGPESAELLPKYGHPSLLFGPSSFMQEDLTTQWDLGLAVWLSDGNLFSTTHLSMLSTAKQSQQKAESKISPDQNADSSKHPNLSVAALRLGERSHSRAHTDMDFHTNLKIQASRLPTNLDDVLMEVFV